MHLRLIMAGALALAGVVAHAATVTVVEYYNASLGHYFMTSDPGQIEILDAHVLYPGWARTGLTFDAYDAASHPASAKAICRMFNDHYNGTSSHFYGTRDVECALTRQLFPDWTYENSEFFDADVPNAAGACPAGQFPVYRVFNNGIGGAPNHRFTNSPDIVAMMVAKGYANEDAHWCTTSPPPEVAPPPQASAAGVWTGTTSAGEPALAMVLDDGTFYVDILKAGQTVESDVVYGKADTTDGRFDAAATDSPIADAAETRGVARAIAVSGTFTEGGALHVTMAGASGARTLDATYAPGAVSGASLATLAGGYAGYTGHADGRQGAGVTIQADGSFSGGNGACSFAGAFTPRGDAPVFAWTIHATAGTTCRFGAGPITGLAFLSADGRKLSAFAPFPTGETDAYFMIVTRP